MAKKKTTTTTKKKSVIEQSKERRDKIVKRGPRKSEMLTEQQRTTVLTLLREGATLAEIFTIRGLASYGSFYATRTADAAFDAEVRQAMAQGAEAAIAEAVEVGKAASNGGDADLMRIAEAFQRCTVSYAEKVAPREFGQLVKLANPDGGALTLHVVNYAGPAVDAKPLQVIDAPPPAIEAPFEEIDPA